MPKFKIDALAKIVREEYDKQIAEYKEAIATLEAQKPHEEAASEWRKEAGKAICGMADRVVDDAVSDEELTQFRLPRYPDNMQYQIDRNKNLIAQEESSRDRTLAFLDAMVKDKDGNVSMSVSDMRAFTMRLRNY